MADWERATYFRDCNGVSNGIPLPPSVIDLELQEREQGRLSADDELLGFLMFFIRKLMKLNCNIGISSNGINADTPINGNAITIGNSNGGNGGLSINDQHDKRKC